MSLCPLQTPDCDAIVAAWVKSAASAPVNAPALAGTLYKSDSGWILLSVPNAIVRGLFSAMHEPGVELPLNSDGQLNAHISVIRPEELAQIGGAEKINERGKQFYYQLGPMQTVVPAGWEGMSRVWFVQIKSPALERLRKSYGLTPLPKNNEFQFHLTVAVRRRNVLYDNDVSKTAAAGHGRFVGSCGHVVQQCRCKDRHEDTPVPVLCAKCLQACADETESNPSDAQKASGNYKKGRCSFHGLPLVFENAKGSTRSGTDKDGNAWSIKMKDHYGYIRGAESEADHDHVDIFLCDEALNSDKVFVVNQHVDGKFDEHKCMLGCGSEAHAREVYLRNYSKDWDGLHSVKEMTIPEFKEWLESGDTSKKAEDGSQLPGEKLKDLRDGKPNTDPEPPKPTDLTMTRQLTPEKVAASAGLITRALTAAARLPGTAGTARLRQLMNTTKRWIPGAMSRAKQIASAPGGGDVPSLLTAPWTQALRKSFYQTRSGAGVRPMPQLPPPGATGPAMYATPVSQSNFDWAAVKSIAPTNNTTAGHAIVGDVSKPSTLFHELGHAKRPAYTVDTVRPSFTATPKALLTEETGAWRRGSQLYRNFLQNVPAEVAETLPTARQLLQTRKPALDTYRLSELSRYLDRLSTGRAGKTMYNTQYSRPVSLLRQLIGARHPQLKTPVKSTHTPEQAADINKRFDAMLQGGA